MDADPGSKAPAEHKAQAPASVACFVLTVSDSRTPETDTGGRAIRELLEAAGHTVTGHAIVKDDPGAVATHVQGQLLHLDTQVIITTGGTGITSRDGTFEAVTARMWERAGRVKAAQRASGASEALTE